MFRSAGDGKLYSRETTGDWNQHKQQDAALSIRRLDFAKSQQDTHTQFGLSHSTSGELIADGLGENRSSSAPESLLIPLSRGPASAEPSLS